jgi:hypothetical protein
MFVNMDAEPFETSATIWLHASQWRWNMVTLDAEASDRIRFDTGPGARPWGYIHAEVTLGTTTWRTMIYPRKGTALFDMPIRAETRKRERVGVGDTVTFTIRVLPQEGGRLVRQGTTS